MGVDIETGSMANPQRYILQADNGVHNDGSMPVPFNIVIPARYGSSRLPGKPLLHLAGKTMLEHVYQRALASMPTCVIIATEDARIAECAQAFGAEVCMTSEQHLSGTDRVAEVAQIYQWDAQAIVVNLQGDEPMMPPEILTQVAENLHHRKHADMATLCTPITHPKHWQDPQVVKVVRDQEDYALYFSRAPIPWERDHIGQKGVVAPPLCYRHIGLYAYRCGYLQQFTTFPECDLENLERLEQLRALYYGARIHVAIAKHVPEQGVDVEKDIERIQKLLQATR